MKSNEISSQPIFLNIFNSNIFKIAEQFVSAEHSLTLNQLKAWVIFISSLDSDQDDGSNLYRFDAIDLASRIGINSRKARGTMVSKLFEGLSTKRIQYFSEPDSKGEQHRLSAYLLSSVLYNKDTHLLQVEISQVIRPFLFALKRGSFLQINTNDILALNTVFSVKVYIFLKNLERKGIFEISVEDFKKGVGATKSYFNKFQDLKKTVILPSIKSIRENTEFKDFYIESDGARGQGKKITRLRFGFVKTIDMDFFDGVPPNQVAICKKFPKDTQIVMRLAIDHGFNPLYIRDSFDNIPNEQIVVNFRYVLQEVIGKDEKRGVNKGPTTYGKYFVAAVKEDWAAKNNKSNEMLSYHKDSVRNQKIQKEMKKVQESESTANEALFRNEMAKNYLANLYKDFKQLNNFIKENYTTLVSMSSNKAFDINKALSGKKTYREYRNMLKLVEAKMLLNEIEVPKQELLFPLK